MNRSLPRLTAAAGLGLALALGLAACEGGDYRETEVVEPPVEAPAAPDAATEAAEPAAPPAEETTPTPEDGGQLPEPAAGEDTVAPESDTLFY